jgi:hypothetical protein
MLLHCRLPEAIASTMSRFLCGFVCLLIGLHPAMPQAQRLPAGVTSVEGIDE